MKILLKLAFFLLLFANAEIVLSQIRLSEIMFDPIGSEYYDEFIEIQNRSVSDTVDLSGWRIGDEKSLDFITDAGFGLRMAPGQFGLILDSGYFKHSTIYDSLIPPDALILTISDNSFGSGGLSNSTPETVSLVNVSGDTVDAYRYSLDNSSGFSDEKIDIFQDSNTGNWANSLRLNGTPGFKNSVAVSAKDLALISVELDSVQFLKKGSLFAQVVVKNVGTTSAANIRLFLFEDKNFDGSFEASDKIGIKSIDQIIMPKDSVSISLSVSKFMPGIHHFLVSIEWSSDENETNNSLEFQGYVQIPSDRISLNEIMYRPSGGSPEWIEIKNVSTDTIQLYQWFLSDENTDRAVKIFSEPHLLFPGKYWIVSQSEILNLPDSLQACEIIVPKWPTLNNSGDEVWIFDPLGQPLDHVNYSRLQLTPPGFSLERLEYPPSSGPTATWEKGRLMGGTPGRSNSINPLLLDGNIKCLSVSPVLTKAEDFASVSFLLQNVGRTAIEPGKIVLFEDENQDGVFTENEIFQQDACFARLAEGDSTVFRINFDDLSSGKHQIMARWKIPGDQDEKNNNVIFEIWKGYPRFTLIINEIMYQPRPGWPEWVEIYNPGTDAISLQDWSFCDRRALARDLFFKDQKIILPKDFLVLSRDSSFFDFYPEVDEGHVFINRAFPSLNNDKDSLFLVDLSGTIIDECEYTSSWGGKNGHSLERIRPKNPATDSTNWSTSVAESGGTPGRQNSIYLQVKTANNWLSILPDPFSPDGDGKDDFVTFDIQTNISTSVVELRIFDSTGRDVRTLLANQAIGSHYECIWDGRDPDGRILPMGIYIAYLELFINHKKFKSIKKAFVLAKQL